MSAESRGESVSHPAEEEVHCSLCVFSSVMAPEDISARVGVAATTMRHKGEPKSGRAEGQTVGVHQWIWEPPGETDCSLDTQMYAISRELGSRATAFRALPAGADVVLDVTIYHRGSILRLGWTLAQEHVAMAAAFGAAISVDEYDYTRS